METTLETVQQYIVFKLDEFTKQLDNCKKEPIKKANAANSSDESDLKYYTDWEEEVGFPFTLMTIEDYNNLLEFDNIDALKMAINLLKNSKGAYYRMKKRLFTAICVMLVAVLSIVSIFIVSNTIKITMFICSIVIIQLHQKFCLIYFINPGWNFIHIIFYTFTIHSITNHNTAYCFTTK